MKSATPSKIILLQYSAKLQKGNPVDIEKIRKFYRLFRDSLPIPPDIAGEDVKNRENFSNAYKFMARLYSSRSQQDSPVEIQDFLAFRDFFESQITLQTPFDIRYLTEELSHAKIPGTALFPNTSVSEGLSFLHSLMARARLDFKYDFAWDEGRQQVSHILIHCQYSVRYLYKAVFDKYSELHGPEFNRVLEARIIEFLNTIISPNGKKYE
ncbi:MAG: hypothetical protein WC506_05715 [Candidatus Micrarchaeia archaeon]